MYCFLALVAEGVQLPHLKTVIRGSKLELPSDAKTLCPRYTK